MAGLAPVPREYWANMALVGILTETSAIPWVSRWTCMRFVFFLCICLTYSTIKLVVRQVLSTQPSSRSTPLSIRMTPNVFTFESQFEKYKVITLHGIFLKILRPVRDPCGVPSQIDRVCLQEMTTETEEALNSEFMVKGHKWSNKIKNNLSDDFTATFHSQYQRSRCRKPPKI